MSSVFFWSFVSIRDRQVAAPLKPARQHTSRRRSAGYPRPTGRGPIEASEAVDPAGNTRRPYPRPTGRGPIEARSRRSRSSRSSCYPRPTGRGPIEAAPCVAYGNGAYPYPRPTGRGPIEAPRGERDGSVALLAIRDRQVAAPLKRAPARGPVLCGDRLSATDRSRPH